MVSQYRDDLTSKPINNLYIKNMVCERCIMAVKQAISLCGLTFKEVSLGKALIEGKPTQEQLRLFQKTIEGLGFEMVDDKKNQTIEKIKSAVIKIVQKDFNKESERINISDYLKKETGFEYAYISTLFSTVERITIEKFVIIHKMERIKELLSYGEYNISEISDIMGYSSVQALSNQFKKVTGISPSDFKNNSLKQRRSLDKLVQ